MTFHARSPQPLSLEPWPCPLQVYVRERAGQVVVEWQDSVPADGRGRYTDGAGILDAFLALAGAADGAPAFVERFGPLYLDQSGFPLSAWSHRPPPKGDPVSGIRRYAGAASAATRAGAWLRQPAGVAPWDDVELIERAVLEYCDRFKKDEPWAFLGGYSRRPNSLPSATEVLAYVEGPERRRGDAQRLRLYQSRLDQMQARRDAEESPAAVATTLQMFLDWWLGLRRIGPFVRLGGGQPFTFSGGAWQAVGVCLAENIAGSELDRIQWCAWGQHYYRLGRRRRRVRSGLLPCCGLARCRKLRSRAQTADSRARRNARRGSVP